MNALADDISPKSVHIAQLSLNLGSVRHAVLCLPVPGNTICAAALNESEQLCFRRRVALGHAGEARRAGTGAVPVL